MRLGKGARPLEVDTPPSSANAHAPGDQHANVTWPGRSPLRCPRGMVRPPPLPRREPQRLKEKEAHMDRRVYERASSDEISWIAVMVLLLALFAVWLIVEL